MKLVTGVDLIEIARIDEVVARHGKHYLERVFTSAELEYCGKRAESLAGRFAAKEAVAKALGTGIGDVSWKEIEILGDEQNAPILTLHGMAENRAKELGLTTWSVSISHSQSHSVALVVAIG
jgi:holo-[acyl-carrier protein] synthase